MKAWMMRLGLVFGISGGGLCLAGETDAKPAPLADTPVTPITSATHSTTNTSYVIQHGIKSTQYPLTATSISGPLWQFEQCIEVFFPRTGVAVSLSGVVSVTDLSRATILDVTPERYAGESKETTFDGNALGIRALSLLSKAETTTSYRPSDILGLTPPALAILEKRIADHVEQRERQAQTTALLRNAITNILPNGWIMKQMTNGAVGPTHLAMGRGMEIQIERTGYTVEDWKHGRGGEVHVWFMPKEYKPGTPPGGEAQVGPAHETIAWRAWRVFVWGSGGTDWPTWEKDITAALQKAEK